MKQSRRKRRWLIALLLLICLALLWLFWPDRQLARAEQLQKELSDQTENPLTAEERRQKRREFNEARKQLSPEQRRKLGNDRRKSRNAEMGRYGRMSQDEKTRYLDDQIERMQQRRQSGGRGQGGRGGSGDQNGTGDSSAAPSSGSRDTRRQDFLDDTTPAERAQMAQFFHDLILRRQQLGMSGGAGRMP